MGLALVVDQVTQLPLAHVLYEGARSDMKTFAEFLKPVRKRLRELTGQPEQLTLVFDAGASSRQNLEGLERYVTAVRPSYHLALLSEAAGHLAEVQLSNGATVRAWRTQRTVAGKQRDVVVVFSPQLYEGQLQGLRQTLSRSGRELEEMQLHPSVSVAAAKRNFRTPDIPPSKLVRFDHWGWPATANLMRRSVLGKRVSAVLRFSHRAATAWDRWGELRGDRVTRSS